MNRADDGIDNGKRTCDIAYRSGHLSTHISEVLTHLLDIVTGIGKGHFKGVVALASKELQVLVNITPVSISKLPYASHLLHLRTYSSYLVRIGLNLVQSTLNASGKIGGEKP